MIFSGDRDFTPVVRLLRSLGKVVWGCGCDENTSELLKEICDQFLVLKKPLRVKAKAIPLRVRPLTHKFLCEAAWSVQVCREAISLTSCNQRMEHFDVYPGPERFRADFFFQALRETSQDFQIADWVNFKKRPRFHLLSALQAEEVVCFEFCPKIKNYLVGPGGKLQDFLCDDPPTFEEAVKNQAYKLQLLKQRHIVPQTPPQEQGNVRLKPT